MATLRALSRLADVAYARQIALRQKNRISNQLRLRMRG
jgi:hypothetical protein